MPAKSKPKKAGRIPAKKAKTGRAAKPRFSDLEFSILQSKGVGEKALARMAKAGIRSKEDFHVVGDSATLARLVGIDSEIAAHVMAWAIGAVGDVTGKVVVETGDVVNCVVCGKRQPKDYHSGDLCVHCGKQAEPVFSCYWCSGSGPGRFCRGCGATFVSPGELELAILLKRDGLSKEEIPAKLSALSPAEKETLWGRVRSRR